MTDREMVSYLRLLSWGVFNGLKSQLKLFKSFLTSPYENIRIIHKETLEVSSYILRLQQSLRTLGEGLSSSEVKQTS